MDQSLTLRRARLSDLAAVDRLLQRSYPRLLAADYPPLTRVLALPIIARARPELLASGRYFVVEAEDGRILGAGGWSLGKPQPRPAAGVVMPSRAVAERDEAEPGWAAQVGMGHVRHVATDPDWLRGGVGRAIMGEVIVEALRAGVHWLDCLSTRTAVPFYAALGFRALHEVEVPLAPGIQFPAVRMMRQIAP
jgi:N-acetylglutamate synthase-like GNAT family acetyltransferase